MELPLPMGSYKHPSRPTNYQICINYFPTSPGPQGRGKVTLLPTQGSILINNDHVEEVRFIQYINGTIYVVIGNKFYSAAIDILAQTATLTEIGTLNTDQGVVNGANNPNQIMLVDGTSGYIYNYVFAGTVTLGTIGGASGNTYTLTINGHSVYSGFNVATALQPEVLVSTINSTANVGVTASYNNGLFTLTANPGTTAIAVSESGTGFVAGVNGITVEPGVFSSTLPFQQFEEINDTDFEGGTHLVYIDGYFITNIPGTASFQFSQPNEGRIWNALDYAKAESTSDTIIALAEWKSELWVIGEKHIEVWYDAGNPVGAPFSKRIGSDIDIGCGAPYSVTTVNDLVIWLDSRGFIVQSDVSPLFRDTSTGYSMTKISDPALDAELATYQTLEDAIGTWYADRGHIMFEITFPTASKTWVYDLNTSAWHERLTTDPQTGELEHSLAQFCAKYNNSTICGGIRNGNLYLLSSDYYYDNETPITRMFTTSHMQDDNLYQQIGVDNLEIKLETGYGGQEGYLADTQVMMQFSDNSGFTWSTELMRPIGRQGDYKKRIIWNMLGTANQWLFLFKITAPIQHAIIGATANMNIEKT